ncbi:hypothetical protein NSK_002935 [Nannochloropsis salina CCMP1776]|uniref:Heme O synthase n=1 Tax=Nannochloropsis salina CCMP1776 TaxID=1027361 RepID=A0A4D9D9G9_9STRA|nr:hypothetical protein NSK_002935 [Nannochloropsis salina CCMP1776]|eukprot:TFJ86115.1 hypothetical protein NSK_002935 [Nannochloropsis salina CCMP1776]
MVVAQVIEGRGPVVPRIVKGSSIRQIAGLCAELGKARLSALVVLTTSSGFLAAGGPVAWLPFTAVSVGTMLAACSANTFNQLLETDNDKRMKRTHLRPLPSGRASRPFALAWAVGSAGASAAVLTAGTNPLTTALGMGNLALYALPYTLSKTRSEANTWIGALVGAVPPLMGWAAATDCASLTSLLSSPDAVLLASILFLWQFPHFFALSWVHRKDYARGGFKMVPCADPGGRRTADLIWRYSLCLAPLPVLATGLGVTGSMFALEGSALNLYLMYLARRFKSERSDERARAVFRCSLWYLPVLLGGFVFHSRQWDSERVKEAVGNTGDSNNLSLERWVSGARKQLAKVCVHEMMLQEGKVKQGGGRERREGGLLCPPVVAGHVVEETKGVVDKVKGEAEASTMRMPLSLRMGDDGVRRE